VTAVAAAACASLKTSIPVCTFTQMSHVICWMRKHAVAQSIRSAWHLLRIAYYSPLPRTNNTTGYRQAVHTGVSPNAKILSGGIRWFQVILRQYTARVYRFAVGQCAQPLSVKTCWKITSLAGSNSSVPAWSETRFLAISRLPVPDLPESAQYKPVTRSDPHPDYRRPWSGNALSRRYLHIQPSVLWLQK